MSNDAWTLLDIIKKEYQDRLNSKIPENQAVIFSRMEFTKNHHLEPEIADDLLHELNNNGYIEYWITGNFVLKVD